MDQPTDETTPNPKRFYWTKRLALAALLLVVLLVGLRLTWGHRVQSRLDQAIADIQSKGEPILFTDLQRELIANDENGAWYLRQALNQWPNVPSNPGLRVTDTDWYIEGEDAGFTDPITDNAAYLKSCEAVFDLLRQADQCQQADWGVQLTRPMFYVLLPQLGESRELARLIEDAARRAVDAGQTELAFDAMVTLHTTARHIQTRPTGLLDSLVAISIMAFKRDLIEYALPRIDPAELRDGPAREKAKAIIARFTDGMLREGFITGMIGERLANYDLYECLLDGTETAANFIGSDEPIAWVIDTPVLSHAYRPALRNEQHTSIEVISKMIAALRNDAQASEIINIQNNFQIEVFDKRLLYPLQGMMFGIYDSAHRTYLRSEALLRCAAAAIAIKLYEADHGKRPDTLEQLVPDYLPAVPLDPFSTTGEPIKYKPLGIVPTVIDEYNQLTDEQRSQLALQPYPLLYSVGDDGIDHGGGTIAMNPEGDLDEQSRFPNAYDGEQGDIWFLLDAWPEAVFDESDLDEDPDDVLGDNSF